MTTNSPTPKAQDPSSFRAPDEWGLLTLRAGASLQALAREYEVGQVIGLIGKVADLTLRERGALSSDLVRRLETMRPCGDAALGDTQSTRPRMAGLLKALEVLTRPSGIVPEALWEQWMPEIPALIARVLGPDWFPGKDVDQYAHHYLSWLQSYSPWCPNDDPVGLP